MEVRQKFKNLNRVYGQVNATFIHFMSKMLRLIEFNFSHPY